MAVNLFLSNLTLPQLPKLNNLFVSETRMDTFSKNLIPDQKLRNIFVSGLGVTGVGLWWWWSLVVVS